MEKFLLAVTTVLILFLSSCSNPAVYYSVWRGNNAFAGGDYQAANTAYLKALESKVHSPYVNYNLANVYYALGEGDAAAAEWEKAVFTSSRELMFRTVYNRGLLEFETGNYEDAFGSFRDALELKSDNMDAKINLEYSLRRMNANVDVTESSAAGAQKSDNEGTSDEIKRILEFIKRKDAGLWSVREENVITTGEKDW
ncbi:MAG: tetratricopeptide repeat protein [Spirochaetales bacterium]|nr:tetratricopeptide repeat protein [Spirochaetales bacterium]